jgi:8-oxo-dGTP pyrophosphatase MutT (NUDIX family)
MESPRLIALRRPPQIAVMDGRFVPTAASLDAVDDAWDRLRARVPRAHDGPMLHVAGTSRNGHGGVVIHCIESSYRFHACTHEGVDAGMRPLGVKGLCRAVDGRLLMARRGSATLNYAGEWEFSPGGSVEPGTTPHAMLERELREETGWTATSRPIARALLFDPVARSWEIVYSVAIAPPAIPVQGWECDEVRLVEPGAWPSPMSAVAVQMVPLTGSVSRVP